MRTVSQGFIDASVSPIGYASAYITIGSTTIDASNIIDITITEDIGGGAFTIGTFGTTEAIMTVVSDALPNVIAGQPISIYFGYYVGTNFEYVPMGVFYAEPRDITHKNLLTTIKAQDKSWSMTNTYTTSLDFTGTVYVLDVLTEIQTALSLTMGSNGGLNPGYVRVYDAPQGSYRDVIAQMAMLIGTNAKLNRTGALDFIKANPSATPVQEYGAYDYSSDNYQLTSDEPMNISKLTVNYTHESNEEQVTDTYVYGSGSHGITLETTNVRTQAETNTLGQSVLGTGAVYYGYSATLPGQPHIDLGDVINITEPLGDDYNFIVLSATHGFNGAMKSTFTAVINDSDPQIAGDNIGNSLRDEVEKVSATVGSQGTRLSRVEDIAGNTDQYFWHTSTGQDTGAHITEVPKEDFIANPSQGGGNLLARSNGIAARNGLTELATFGANGSRIGAIANNTSRTEIASTGIDFISRNSSGTDVNLAHIGYESGTAEIGTAIAPYYTFGTRKSGSTFGNYSMAEGSGNEASGYISHAEGKGTIASGLASHAEGWANQGYNITASGDGSHAEGYAVYKSVLASADGSHAEGSGATASGFASHAEGNQTTASGNNSHAEGQVSSASGVNSHAEGHHSTASGIGSHAEGYETTASGDYSHSSGHNTIAQGEGQTVIGKYNVADTTSAFIIGKGDLATRSNALTVDWNGNVNIASDAHYKINGSNLSALDVDALPISGGTLTGNLYINGSVNVKNASGINSYNGSNTLRTLAFISSTDNYFFGSGSYDNSEGSAYYEGNEVTIRSRGAVNITAPSGVSLTGGLNVTGSVKLSAGYTFDGITRKSSSTSGSWANDRFRFLDADGTAYAWLGAYGTVNTFSYMYLGVNAYNGNNLRVYDDGHIWANGIVNNGTYNELFKIATATATVASGSAGSAVSQASYEITGIPTGYTPVGIVGITTSSNNVLAQNWRLYDATHVRSAFVRIYATTSNTTVTFNVLCLKATSA